MRLIKETNRRPEKGLFAYITPKHIFFRASWSVIAHFAVYRQFLRGFL